MSLLMAELFLTTSLFPSYALALEKNLPSLTAKKTFPQAPGIPYGQPLDLLRQRTSKDGGIAKEIQENLTAKDGGNRILNMTKAQFLLEHRVRGYIRGGYFGGQRPEIVEQLNKWLGEDGWLIVHRIGDRFVPEEEAVRLYEEAYYVYFTENEKGKQLLEELLEVAKDVYDTDPSNVNSGTDYSIQETDARHLQDIAIRRVVQKLGKQFRGQELVQIRGKYSNGWNSKGFFLNPGMVPFHKKELMKGFLEEERNKRQRVPHIKGWWKRGSIEDFLQNTKVIVLLKDPYRRGTVPKRMRRGELIDLSVAVVPIFEKLSPFIYQNLLPLNDIDPPFWTLDLTDFPLDQKGHPRKFTHQEIERIFNEILHLFASEELNIPTLVRRTSPQAQEWYLNFTNPTKVIPDVEHVKQYTQALPLFFDVLQEKGVLQKKGTVPIFLIRDALTMYEFGKYVALLQRKKYKAHLLYLPGSPTTRGIAERARDTTLEHVFGQTTNIVKEIWHEWITEAPEKYVAPGRKLKNDFSDFERRFSEKFGVLLETDPVYRDYSWKLYQHFKEWKIPHWKPLVILDTSGTGKSILYLKNVIQHFSEKEGTPYQVDVLLGWSRDKPLSVPELGDFVEGITEDPFPDFHWPFRYKGTDPNSGEHLFSTSKNIAKLFLLLYQSLQLYNAAVDYVASDRATARDGGKRAVQPAPLRIYVPEIWILDGSI
ncbi:MAG: hypothetical protein HY590_02930 [Candidatus Omnitrophica bacterium]|nr:hypothetical protein [Candidatus Omnitrophota bacterium]